MGPDLPKKQQDEPKRAIRSFKDQKTAFSKPLKNICFLHVFGSRGIPREHQEAQEGPQEASKELQHLKKSQKNKKIESMVENALARRSRFGGFLLPILKPSRPPFFDNFLTTLTTF